MREFDDDEDGSGNELYHLEISFEVHAHQKRDEMRVCD